MKMPKWTRFIHDGEHFYVLQVHFDQSNWTRFFKKKILLHTKEMKLNELQIIAMK